MWIVLDLIPKKRHELNVHMGVQICPLNFVGGIDVCSTTTTIFI